MTLLRRMVEALKLLAEARKAVAERLLAEEAIRRAKINSAEDLDHAYLSRVIESIKDDTVVTIFLRSGETVRICRRLDAEGKEEGDPAW